MRPATELRHAVAHLEAENARLQSQLNAATEALTGLCDLWRNYQDSDLSQMNAHDCLVRYETWDKAIAALKTVGSMG